MLNFGKLYIRNNVLLSPMEGVNCKAFRQTCWEYGAGLVATPMILVNNLIADEKRTLSVVEFSKNEHPLWVQLGGSDSEMIKKATLIVNEYADAIDMNLGCPESDVLALKAGSFFAKHPEQLKKAIPPIMNNTNKPVTAKIRIGWDENSKNTLQSCKILKDFGVAAITIHARTRNQSYRYEADWNEIKKAKQFITDIPIIGNGDIASPGDAKAMIDKTGCDGVMIARAAKGNPIIFRDTVNFLNTGKKNPPPTDKDRAKAFLVFSKFYSKQIRQSFTEFRQHALWFTNSMRQATIVKTQIEKCTNQEQINALYKDLLR